MRVDLVSIFPEYFDVLDVSLTGRARRAGLLDVRVHDLRSWTHDRHRTVDDTPYGGGAGMVMRPEPWGECLDELLADPPGAEALLVVPTPSGEVLTQDLAAELAGEQRLVVACGRYEGIDQRVLDYARSRVRVREVSLGDYVLNGGEVAALVLLEATVRLVPGFMGNAASLSEESHTAGLLEYPVYTKPATWRGLDVPPVLLSGDHARVAAWRRDQAVRRTAARRPDLVHPSAAVTAGGLADAVWRRATRADAGELLTLQRACWAGQEPPPDGPDAEVLRETVEQLLAGLGRADTFVLRAAGRLVGTARARLEGEEWRVGRLMVAPDLRGHGLGRWMLERVQESAPPGATRCGAVVGDGQAAAARLLRRAGYRPARPRPGPGLTHLVRRRR